MRRYSRRVFRLQHREGYQLDAGGDRVRRRSRLQGGILGQDGHTAVVGRQRCAEMVSAQRQKADRPSQGEQPENPVGNAAGLESGIFSRSHHPTQPFLQSHGVSKFSFRVYCTVDTSIHQDSEPEGGEVHATRRQVQDSDAHSERHAAQTTGHVDHRRREIFRVKSFSKLLVFRRRPRNATKFYV